MKIYLERIENYLGGEMLEEERRRFEADMAANSDLRAAFELYRRGDGLIEWRIAENLRAQFEAWAREEKATSGARVLRFRRFGLALAAGLALLLSLWFVIDRLPGAAMDDAALFAAYYQAPAASSLRGAEAEERPSAPGLRLLEEGAAEAARDYFLNLMEQTPENTEYRYYLGHAYIALNDWNAAIDAFASTERSAPFALAQRAAWNRALALLAAGRDAEGVALLEAIAADAGHGFSRQAGELLGKRKR